MAKKNTGIPFLFILLALVCQSLAMIFGKCAALNMDAYTPRAIAANPYYLASLFCLGLQALCWPLALRRFELFWAYMFMSGIYIVIPLASHFVFKEKVSAANIIGAAVIVVGITVMFLNGRGEKNG